VIKPLLCDRLTALQCGERRLQQGVADAALIRKFNLSVAGFNYRDSYNACIDDLGGNDRARERIAVVVIIVADACHGGGKLLQCDAFTFGGGHQTVQRCGIKQDIARHLDARH